MAQFGAGVNPQLGAIDYSAYSQGAAQGSAAIGRGIASLGEGIGQGIKNYFKEQEENKGMMGNLMATDKETMAEASKDPLIARALEGLNKGKSPNRKDLIYATAKIATLKTNQERAFKSWQQDQQKLEAAEQERVRAALPELLAPTSAAKDAILNGMTFDKLGSLGSGAFDERPVDAQTFFQRATKAKMPMNVIQTIGTQLSQQDEINARKGKQPNLGFQEENVAAQVYALETKMGRRATPQEKADIFTSVSRGASMAGDPEEKTRMELLSKDLPVVGERADAALRLKPTIRSIMGKLASGVQTGRVEGLKTDIIGFARSFNLPVDESKLGDAESMRAQMSQLMFEWLNQTKGSVSERENTLFQLMGPEFSKGNAANNDLMELVQSRMDLDIELGSIYRNGLRSGKKIPAISGELQDARERFSAKYDKHVDTLFESYSRKDAIRKEIAAELERRKKPEGQ